MMFRAKTENWKVLVDSLKGISNLIKETNIVVNNDGLEILALDPAGVGMVKFFMPAKLFSEWSICNVEKSFLFGVTIKDLNNVLSKLSKDATLIIEVDQEIHLKIDLKGKFKEFTLGVLNLDIKAQKVPDLKFNCIVSIPVVDFEDALNDAGIVSETCVLDVDANKIFRINGKGDINKSSSTLLNTVYTKYEMASSKYSLEYLNNMVCKQLGNNVSISLGNSYPLMIEYVELSGTRLTYILAPRMNND